MTADAQFALARFSEHELQAGGVCFVAGEAGNFSVPAGGVVCRDDHAGCRINIHRV